MFESRLYLIRNKIDKIGRRGERLLLNSCASPTQITEFEAKFGLSLPDEYREFVLQIGDGGYLGLLHIGALSVDELTPNDRGLQVYPTVFPLRHVAHPDGWETYHLSPWSELTAAEKSESQAALCFGMWRGRGLPALILSGRQRDQVYHGCFYAELDEAKDLDSFDGLHFFDWLEGVLDLQAAETA